MRAADEPFLEIETGGHTARVMQVAFTRDGSRLISVGFDKVVRVWDVRTGQQIQTLRGQVGPRFQGALNAAAVGVGADGQPIVATGGFDVIQGLRTNGEIERASKRNSFNLFTLADGKIARTFSAEGMDTVVALAFSPDSHRIASGGADNRIGLWDAATGSHRMLSGHAGAVYDLAFSPDGALLVSASRDSTVRFWQTDSGRERQTIELKAQVLSVDWSAQGIVAAGTYEDHRIHLISAATGKETGSLSQPDAAPCVAFSPKGDWLLSGSGATVEDFKVRLWNVADRTLLRTFDKHTSTVLSVTFSPDGKHAASADASGTIYLWNPDTGDVEFRLSGAGAPVLAVTWLADPTRRILAWGGENTAPADLPHRFDLNTNQPSPALPAEARFVSPVTERQGRRLVLHSPINDPNASPYVTVEEGGREVARITDDQWEKGERVYSALYLPDGDVVVGSDFGLRRYAVPSSGKPRRKTVYVGHSAAVRTLCVSPDGKYLASGSEDQMVRIWNLAATGRRIGAESDAVQALVTLFRGRDGTWVAWNDRFGYYAASPTGDDVIGWRVNRGPGKAADFYTAYQFAARYYRPDIVCRLLETGSPEAARARVAVLAQSEPPVTSPVLNPPPPPTLPPPITPPIVAPTPGLRTDLIPDIVPAPRLSPPPPPTASLLDELSTSPPPKVENVRVPLAFLAADGVFETKKPTLDVTVSVADADLNTITFQYMVNRLAGSLGGSQVKSPGAAREAHVPVTLVPGENIVRILGRRIDGIESAPVTVHIRYTPPAPVKQDRQLYVLSIGVSEYRDKQIADRQFAANDAEAIAHVYEEQRGRLFDEVKSVPLTNGGATRERILGEIAKMEDFVKKHDFESHREDMVVVYISSQGLSENREFFLVPQDADPSNLAKTGIAWGDVVRRLRNLPAVNVVLLLDNFASLSAADPSGEPKERLRSAFAVKDADTLERLRGFNALNQVHRGLRQQNLFTLSSSNSDQISFFSSQLNHSLFANALLKALNTRKPESLRSSLLTARGEMTLDSLEQFVHRDIENQLTSLFGPAGRDRQTPMLYSLPGTNTRIPMALVL